MSGLGVINRVEPNGRVALPPVGGLVGRDDDVDSLLGRLSQVHMLTLTGPPGVGKSRLALEVAGRLRAGGLAGAVIVSVEAMSSAGQLEATVAHVLGEAEREPSAIRAHSGAWPEVQLLVLDDCDHLLRACAEVSHRLLSRGLRVLATAREPLGVPGESTWRVPPLPVPPPDHGEPGELFAESEAVQLLCDRAAYANRDFVATPDTAPAIAEICRRLDGVPLAIELAARVMTAYAPLDVVDHLDDPFSLLNTGPRTVHARHQSLWGCLAWSYDLLSVPEQMVLEGLAVFPGRFTGQAAVDVCIPDGMAEAEFEEVLRALVDKSLIEVETLPGGARYRLLGMIRWFGLEKLAAGGEEKAQRDEHARWCAGVVEAAGNPRRGRSWLERMEPVHDDIHAAVDWALASGGGETAVVLAEADARLCRALGRYREARERLQQVAAAVAAPPTARARALAVAGIAEAVAGHPAVATLQLDESVAIADGLGAGTLAARARLWLAFTRVLESGRASLVAMEGVTAQTDSAEDPSLATDTLAMRGHALLAVGAPASGGDCFDKSLELARRHADEIGEAHALVGLGRAKVVLGHDHEAKALLSQGLELARALGEGEAVGSALVALGEADMLQGNAEAAEAWFSQAAESMEAADNLAVKAQALVGLGRLAIGRGDRISARELFDAGLAAARMAAIGHVVAPALCGAAVLTVDPVEAQSLVAEALTAAQHCGDQAGEGLALEHLARLSQVKGDLSSAARHHGEALALRAGIGDPAAIADSIQALGSLAADRGDFSVAARLLGASEAIRQRHGRVPLPWALNQHRSQLEVLREALGDEALETDRQHGASLSASAVLAYASRYGAKRPRPSTGLEALTPAERTIAELVAEGGTNADIARHLGVSPTTVKAHLRLAFAKLAVQNRTALAAALHATGE